MPRWNYETDIAWDQFDRSKVDPDLLKVIKAAGLTEYNADHYTLYLRNVFHDDPEFHAQAEEWAREEVQHGLVLGRWAELADPGYDFRATFDKFKDGYVIPVDVEASIRGSRTGELVARCVVETGTSSFYAALADAAAEPVLQDICRRIAGDEFRHYKMFYDKAGAYQRRERTSLWHRLAVVVGRVRESDDDELAFAYHCANEPHLTYDRARSNRDYGCRAYAVYREDHVQRAVNMLFKAVGLNPQGWLGRVVARHAWKLMQGRAAALQATSDIRAC